MGCPYGGIPGAVYRFQKTHPMNDTLHSDPAAFQRNSQSDISPLGLESNLSIVP